MKILGKKLLIKKDILPQKRGEIWLPATSSDSSFPPYTGIIVSVGAHCPDPDITPGIRVAYHWSSSTSVIIDDVEHIIIDYDKVSGILDKTYRVS